MEFILGKEPNICHFRFEIPEVDDNGDPFTEIGILLSGGLDSTILTCLIIEELKRTNRFGTIPVSVFSFNKKGHDVKYAVRMASILEDHYNFSFKSKTFDIPNSDGDIGRCGVAEFEQMKIENPNTIFFWGLNRMAPDGMYDRKFTLRVNYRDSVNIQVQKPYINMIKPCMVDLYEKLNVGFLRKYTHTCTVNFDSHCNNCYSCEEKAWTYSVLGLEHEFEPIEEPNVNV